MADKRGKGDVPPNPKPTRSSASPNLDFVERMSGTLPETVTAGDLEILNAGLQWLFADLRRAHRYFQNGEGYGRGGAGTALGALWRFIVLFKVPFAEGLHVPIIKLQQALLALNDNNVLPMLKPVKRAGRVKSSDEREALKGWAAGTVQRLLQSGLKPAEAHRLVAKELRRLSVRSERRTGDISDTTIRHWCDDVAADVGQHGIASTLYASMHTDEATRRFSLLPSDKARRDIALRSLADFVRGAFPEFQKPS